MKIIIQIPCFNEEKFIGTTLDALPRNIAGMDSVEFLVVDDGSTDATADEATAHGAHHIIRLPVHSGLAAAFTAGVKAALALGADIVVNTDADNQYPASSIPALIAPIASGEADLVIGARSARSRPHLSRARLVIHDLASAFVRRLSKVPAADPSCGFRALNKKAAQSIHILSRYTYTVDAVIQAGQRGLRVASLPIDVNPPKRPSRLFSSLPVYLTRQLKAALFTIAVYRPVPFFTVPAGALLSMGVLCVLHSVFGADAGRPSCDPSLILACLFFSLGFAAAVGAILGALISANRELLERTLITPQQEGDNKR